MKDECREQFEKARGEFLTLLSSVNKNPSEGIEFENCYMGQPHYHAMSAWWCLEQCKELDKGGELP